MGLGFNKGSSIARLKLFIFFVMMSAVLFFSFEQRASTQDSAGKKVLDPKAWGGNHVGKPIPEYLHGDECLFCHRNDIGVTWQKNAHGVAVRQREDAPDLVKMVEGQSALAEEAKQIEYFLGSRNRVRFLKKEGYGKFAILNAQAVLSENGQAINPPKIIDGEKLAWDKEKFANRCAGCHCSTRPWCAW